MDSLSFMRHGIKNYLTIDVEDYFQVSAFENVVGFQKWDEYSLRVKENTWRILDLFSVHEVTATFFILGWIAEKLPILVREIAARGHEIACHGYSHRLVYNLTPEEFKEDTSKSKDILEQIIGKPVLGYRAPSYSITARSLWALEILAELGFAYDSSIFPIHHDRYGLPGAPRFKYDHQHLNLAEYPISTVLICGRKIPIAGGGYFRLFPYGFTRRALKKINQKERQPFIFYFHPWEIDPDQPRMSGISLLSRFRHYINLNKTFDRLNRLLSDFTFRPITQLSR